jgi:hypothetical protein
VNGCGLTIGQLEPFYLFKAENAWPCMGLACPLQVRRNQGYWICSAQENLSNESCCRRMSTYLSTVSYFDRTWDARRRTLDRVMREIYHEGKMLKSKQPETSPGMRWLSRFSGFLFDRKCPLCTSILFTEAEHQSLDRLLTMLSFHPVRCANCFRRYYSFAKG